MSYLLPNALAAALAVPDLELKLAAFRGFVAEVLQSHDPDFRVVTYESEAVTSADDRRARVAVMGDPARYAEVLYAGDDGRWETDDDARHVVNVFLYYGVGAASRADAADAFRALLESKTSPYGLLHAVRAQGQIEVQGDETDTDGDAIPSASGFAGFPVVVAAPSQVAATLAYPEDFPDDAQYEAAFTVTLT